MSEDDEKSVEVEIDKEKLVDEVTDAWTEVEKEDIRRELRKHLPKKGKPKLVPQPTSPDGTAPTFRAEPPVYYYPPEEKRRISFPSGTFRVVLLLVILFGFLISSSWAMMYYSTNIKIKQIQEPLHTCGKEVVVDSLFGITEGILLLNDTNAPYELFNVTVWGDYGMNLSISVEAPDIVFAYFNVTLSKWTGTVWDTVQLYGKNGTGKISQINATIADEQTAYLFVQEITGDTTETTMYRIVARYSVIEGSSIYTDIVIPIAYASERWFS